MFSTSRDLDPVRTAIRGDLLDFTATPAWGDVYSSAVRYRPDHWLLIENGVIPRNESCVICITGNGLKTQEAITDHIGKPYKIKPSVDAFEKALRSDDRIKEDVWEKK